MLLIQPVPKEPVGSNALTKSKDKGVSASLPNRKPKLPPRHARWRCHSYIHQIVKEQNGRMHPPEPTTFCRPFHFTRMSNGGRPARRELLTPFESVPYQPPPTQQILREQRPRVQSKRKVYCDRKALSNGVPTKIVYPATHPARAPRGLFFRVNLAVFN